MLAGRRPLPLSSTHSLPQPRNDAPLLLLGVNTLPYAPVEEEREVSCPVSPLLLQPLVKDSGKGFLVPGDRAGGWGILDWATK